MKVTSSDPFVKNETIYQGFQVEFGKMLWSITVSHGKFNEVRVKKVSNNPFGTMGKFFDSFSDAIDNYKSPSMRNALHKVQFQFQIINDVVMN